MIVPKVIAARQSAQLSTTVCGANSIASQTSSAAHNTIEPRNAPDSLEEGADAYSIGGFHPVYIGDVYNSRYRILNKIGYGAYSTVWLIKDLNAKQGSRKEFQALKILSAMAYDPEHPVFEREIMAHLRAGDQNLLGYAYICHMLDTFELEGPNGTHVCLVLELMGESLRTFGTLWKECEIPYVVMRRFTIQLLLALDYAHDCNVIHTDIQPANIYVKFRDYSRIESGYLIDCPPPKQDRSEVRYTVIPSRPLRGYYFSDGDKSKIDEFDVTLGDWGVSSWADQHLCSLIQPVALRSPEVLIKAPWDASTDIWNLGAVIYELFRAIRLFSGRTPPSNEYEVRRHLAEIVDLFGPFPKELLEKGDQAMVVELFDDKGMVIGVEPLARPDFCSDTWFPRLSDDLRQDSASFLRMMMKVSPVERPTPEDLLRHPWLAFLHD